MDSTIQRADEKPYGVNYRMCPETTETQMNVRRCFAVNGSEAAPTAIQPVLPDLSDFEVLKYFSHAVLLVYPLYSIVINRHWFKCFLTGPSKCYPPGPSCSTGG